MKNLHIKILHALKRIKLLLYQFFLSVLLLTGKTKSGPLIQHMWDQEKEHLRVFTELIPKYRARPTVLLPFWNVAGFALGAGKLIALFCL